MNECQIARQAVDAALDRLAQTEPDLHAWLHLDPDHARAQADALDSREAAVAPRGRLFGVPVGIKDIYDTADHPTENGSVLDSGRRPARDAFVVSRLRAEGAVILGKTVTTEYACFAPGPTRNPHDLARTPGGSSSGSAAAVAAGVVPIALGSQTNGSVIRPASFCGVHGYKPTFGLIPRTGCLATAQHLDTVGFFARSLEDLALLAECLIGHDPADPATRPLPAPPLLRVLAEAPPTPPRLAFVKGPTWDQAEPTTQAAFTALAERLGSHVEPLKLPPLFDDAVEAHRTIWTAELAFQLKDRWERGAARLSPQLRELIEHGRSVPAHLYQIALAKRLDCTAALDRILRGFDAILTPAAPGEAPLGMATGSPAFCSLWTLAGLPALSLPLLKGPNGLPLGCQLVGASGDDARLLRTGRWLEGMA